MGDFEERFRAVRHLTDKRRPKCRHAVLQKRPRLPAADVQMWEARDCERKRRARQLHTHYCDRLCHYSTRQASGPCPKVTGPMCHHAYASHLETPPGALAAP